MVQARVRGVRDRSGGRPRRPARGALRGVAAGLGARLDGADAPAVLDAGGALPGPEAKGAVIGFGDVHGRAHVYRAILEGLAYALRERAERTVKRSKVPIRELRISGGGSQSRAAAQLFADVFGQPASRPHTHEAAGLGAAIDVMLGLRIHADPIDAVAAVVRVADRLSEATRVREPAGRPSR